MATTNADAYLDAAYLEDVLKGDLGDRASRVKDAFAKLQSEHADFKAALTEIAGNGDRGSGVCPGRGCNSPEVAQNVLRGRGVRLTGDVLAMVIKRFDDDTAHGLWTTEEILLILRAAL